MEISEKTVEKLSALAKLSFSEDEKKRIVPELSRILSFMEESRTFLPEDACRKEEKSNDGKESCHRRDSFRKDEPQNSFEREELLGNAPNRNLQTIIVPKTVED